MSAVVAAVGRSLDPATRAWVQEATMLSRSAGPDGDAVHLGERFGLGHTWLRTSATEGLQPVSLDGRTWLAADARLDDRGTLITALRAHRRDVSTSTSDAELVLHSHATWPDHFLDHLAGDFAFALWDDRRQRLVCARDQLGTTPLHYARITGGLLVATSIDALRLHPAVSDDLDEVAVADFLIIGHSQDFGSTMFTDVRRVPPAHTLGWADGQLELSRYWHFPQWRPLLRFGHPQEASDRFGELLDAATADRITTDRVVVHLSGGMDSTSIAASATVALRSRGAPSDAVRAMTAVLGGSSGDREGEFARLVAEALGVGVDLIDGSTMPPLDPQAAPLLVTSEPTPYRRTAFEYETARVPAAHAPVALSGIGGDPLLWSSPWYWAEWLARGQVRRLTRAFGDHLRLFGTRLHPALRPGLAGLPARRAAGTTPLPGWLDAEFVARTRALERRPPVRPPAAGLDVRSLSGDPFWTTLCTRGHPSFTGLPVRFRYPLLDLRLLRFAAALPPEPWLQNKRILRDATLHRLPAEVRQRPKAPLVDAPLPGHSAAVMERLSSFVRQVPELDRFLDREAVAAALTMVGDHPSGRGEIELARPLGLAHWLAHRFRPECLPLPDAAKPPAV
jgi:asparagine synthase (glutamine-hydrolysing)